MSESFRTVHFWSSNESLIVRSEFHTVGVASAAEVNFNLTGFMIQVRFPFLFFSHLLLTNPYSHSQMVAIAIEATRVTLIQLLLTSSSSTSESKSSSPMSPLKSLYYFAPICLLLNLALLLPLEGFQALREIPIKLGWWIVISNASLTFGLNLSAVMLIGLSSMVLSLSKVVKDVLMVVAPALLLGESVRLP